MISWYKIYLNDGSESGRTYVGSSPDSFETLAEKAAQGKFIRLDDLLFHDRGEIKDWEQWDARDVPSVFMNGTAVVSIQPFKGDPRTLPK